ncbi:MAG: 2-oxoglutarate dehydrogenase complex dihydrolipoyllysine-residue succinyltransferase [Cytophagales bacterium]|nr:2-oxoglutarate dehydrogenase complex dihydrolipoyllysine-residue succinyltransferase [Cytophagales bacterium]
MSIEIKVPTVGESITEVTVANWMKNDGDYVELDEILCELESDKATFELNAEAAGLLHIIAKEGDTLEIGAIICNIDTDVSAKPKEKASQTEPAIPVETQPAIQKDTPDLPEKTEKVVETAEVAGKSNYAADHPSPAAAKILDEKGMKPGEVDGTGKDGRITKEDAIKAEKQPATSTLHPAFNRIERREKMSSFRRTISRRLVAVKNETAMLTTFNEVNMKPIMDLRKKYKEPFKEKYEVGLGFMSFFTKACCLALQEFPAVNAMLDGDEIIYHDFCDISIAVSAPKGLVVPVVRNAESLSFAEIEKEIADLAAKARDNKITIEEMTGGTFSITNGGVFGSMMSTPILNPPQSAILGMHNIVERPVAISGEIEIRPMMFVALSYDHRIIDGRESVSFLVRVKELLEDPARLLLGI